MTRKRPLRYKKGNDVKFIIVGALLSLGSLAMAAETSSFSASSMKKPELNPPPYMRSTEAGTAITSLNNGTQLFSLAGFYEFDNGYALGGRTLLPVGGGNYQVYKLELLGRMFITNDDNITFLEANLSEIAFNRPNGADFGTSLGLSYGYKHQFTNSFSVGGAAGLELATGTLAHNEFNGTRGRLYNRLDITASYYY